MRIDKKYIRISFDYDGCLTLTEVKGVAMALVHEGYDVLVVTSRLDSHKNHDLMIAMKEVGIQKVIFTNHEKKYLFMDSIDIHLDNDTGELALIARNSECVVVDVTKDGWQDLLHEKLKHLTIWH